MGGGHFSQTVSLPSGEELRMEIWDTAGQERFRAIIPVYYKDATAAMV